MHSVAEQILWDKVYTKGKALLGHPDALPANKTLEKLRHYAKQARAEAAKKPFPAAIEQHKMFLKAGQRHGSFGPVPSPGPGAAASPARREAALTVLLGQIAGHAAQNRFLRMAAGGGAHGQMVSAAPTASTAFPSFAPRAATQSAGFAPSPPRRQVSAPPAVSSLEALIASPPAFPQHLTFKQELELKNAVGDYFAQQARLPPNGYSGFDPLLSPAWPGLKTRH